MYICTFYSFKGGVGRSLALVNVAAHLAQSGKRVLLVDFDLEAPGLDTFELLRHNGNTPGIVEYVQKYLKENRVPNVSDYIAQSTITDGMYLLPSGDAKRNYAQNAFQIDWKDLYANREGYLLFEDMKVQWQKEIQPDYVFIDSRTGYSDTSGICTRHLPDAVVILFFPNDQNLRGIAKVVKGIRGEAESTRQKRIALHFVMSNVPFLDDEDEIIDEFQQRFADELQFEECHVIHRYDSLPLLQQSVFTTSRPRSRLAKEYKQLADQISRRNIEDRNGALSQLDQYWERLNSSNKVEDIAVATRRVSDETETLNQIAERFPRDFEILFNLARLWTKGGNLPGSDLNPRRLISDAVDRVPSDHQKAEMLVTLAEDSLPEYAATEFALEALNYPTTLHTLKRVMDCLGGPMAGYWNIDIDQKIERSAAISDLSIEDQCSLALYLERNNYRLYSHTVLSNIVNDHASDDETASALSLLNRNQIALGDFEPTIELLLSKYSTVHEMSLIDAFNFGVATWGKHDTPNNEPFLYIRDQIDVHHSELDANRPQEAYDTIRFSTNPDQDFGGVQLTDEDFLNRVFRGHDQEDTRSFDEYELAQIYIFCCWILKEAGNSLQRWDFLIKQFGLSNSNYLFSYWQYKYVTFDEFRSEYLNMASELNENSSTLSTPPCVNLVREPIIVTKLATETST